MDKVILILDKFFMKNEGGGQIEIPPPPPSPEKTTHKKPSLIRFSYTILDSSVGKICYQS